MESGHGRNDGVHGVVMFEIPRESGPGISKRRESTVDQKKNNITRGTTVQFLLRFQLPVSLFQFIDSHIGESSVRFTIRTILSRTFIYLYLITVDQRKNNIIRGPFRCENSLTHRSVNPRLYL